MNVNNRKYLIHTKQRLFHHNICYDAIATIGKPLSANETRTFSPNIISYMETIVVFGRDKSRVTFEIVYSVCQHGSTLTISTQLNRIS